MFARPRRAAALALIAISLAAIPVFVFARKAPRSRVLRLGVTHSPPYTVVNQDGSVTGFAIELLREAARRRGFELRGVPSPRGPEVAFGEKTVDLWPMITILPERRKFIHMTDPILVARYQVVVTRASGIHELRELRSHDFATLGLPIFVRLIHDDIPDAQIRSERNWPEVLEAVCTGRASAGFFDQRPLEGVLLDRPPACRDLAITAIPVPHTGRLAIGSTREASDAADALSQETITLTEEGKTAQLFAKWLRTGPDETQALQDAVKARRDKRVLAIWLTGLGLLLVFAMTQVHRVKIAQRTLEAVSAEAQRANQAKSVFLANMTHELRTPINGVMGMTDLLRQTKLDAEQRDYADVVALSAECLLTVVNDILDYSKIEAGRLDLEIREFSVEEMIHSALDVVRSQATAKKIELRVESGPGLPATVSGDPVRLRQVLLNLLGNAVKFTHSGHVLLRCDPVSEAGGRTALRFTIEDTGIGIAPEVMTKLFRPFSQADSSTTRRYGGTGLGLAICRKIVDLMGGDIAVTSQLGAGSRFWFTIPSQLRT